jgi:hypothetical protein
MSLVFTTLWPQKSNNTTIPIQLDVTEENAKLNSVALVRKQLYRPRDRRLSAKLVPNLRIEGVVWSAQRIPTAINLGFLDPEPLLFHSSSSSVILIPFQTHFSENLVASGIERGISGSVAWNSDH